MLISNFRVVGWYYHFHSNFNGILCKQTSETHSVASDLALHFLHKSNKEDWVTLEQSKIRIYGLINSKTKIVEVVSILNLVMLNYVLHDILLFQEKIDLDQQVNG